MLAVVNCSCERRMATFISLEPETKWSGLAGKWRCLTQFGWWNGAVCWRKQTMRRDWSETPNTGSGRVSSADSASLYAVTSQELLTVKWSSHHWTCWSSGSAFAPSANPASTLNPPPNPHMLRLLTRHSAFCVNVNQELKKGNVGIELEVSVLGREHINAGIADIVWL